MQLFNWDNVTWFYLNNPSAKNSDVIMSEDGFIWFRHGDVINDSYDFDSNFDDLRFGEWADNMSNFGIRWSAVGDRSNWENAYKKVWEFIS